MKEQSCNSVIMVRPDYFGFNLLSEESNIFQSNIQVNDEAVLHKKASSEFDHFVSTLRSNSITAHVFEDTPEPHTPDAVFPNNWFSVMPDGKLVLYPMEPVNRRAERRQDIIDFLQKNYEVTNIIDLSHNEKDNRFLEGTGSLIFDYPNKKVYANISSRTDARLAKQVAGMLGYTPVLFNAVIKNKPVYHTNVILSIAS